MKDPFIDESQKYKRLDTSNLEPPPPKQSLYQKDDPTEEDELEDFKEDLLNAQLQVVNYGPYEEVLPFFQEKPLQSQWEEE